MIDCFKKIFSKNKLDHYQVISADSILLIDQLKWDSVPHNLFLSYKFLSSYESILANELSFKYVIVLKDNIPLFHTCFQIKDFQAAELSTMLEREMVNLRKKRNKFLSILFEKYADKNLVRMITCGNNIITGENAFSYDSQRINRQEAFDILVNIIEGIEYETKSNKRICGILAKDFYMNSIQGLDDQDEYIPFQIDPEMQILLPNDIKSLEEYIQLFSKKYRNRAKHVLEKKEAFEVRLLDKTQIQFYENDILKLYKEVVSNADFILIETPNHYFREMKFQLGDLFNIYGYFNKAQQLIAFRSSILSSEDTLEAHFIGVNYELNKSLELYQNILYDYISEAFECNCKLLKLGRTASEIKTTVGAIPVEMYCFIKPSNKISELIVHPYLKYLQPKVFQPRHPFKNKLIESV